MKLDAVSTPGFGITMWRTELVAFANALNEVLNGPHAIDEWEFETRMGLPRDEAVQLLAEANGFLNRR